VADSESVDKIVQQFEIRGVARAIVEYDRLATNVRKAASALADAKRAADQMVASKWHGVPEQRIAAKFIPQQYGPGGVVSSPSRLEPERVVPAVAGLKAKGAEFMAKAFKSANFEMIKSFTVAGVLTQVIDGAVRSLINFAAHAWDVAVAFERARTRVTGLTLGLVDFRRVQSDKPGAPAVDVSSFEKLGIAQKASNILLDEFRQSAMAGVGSVEQLEHAFANVDPVLSSVGKSQLDVLNITKAAARAAKVYGEDAAEMGKIAAKAIAQGVVEGESAMAQSLKAQAQVSSKLPIEERYKRVAAVLERMGAPLSAINKTTSVAFEKWGAFANDILRRLVEPIFERVGILANRVVDALVANQGPIDAVVDTLREWLNVGMDLLGVVWDVVAGVVAWVWQFGRLGEMVNAVWKVCEFLMKGVDVAVTGLQGLVELIAGDEKGFGKLLAISTAIEVKWRELSMSVTKVVHAIANVFADDKSLTLLGMDFGGYEKEYASKTETLAKRLRAQEKAAGLSGLSETSRRLEALEKGAGLDKLTAHGFLAGLKGLKVQQNIGEVNIQQDFRDQDPDAVWLVFKRGLERLGEASVQSNASSAATAFEAGASSY
jgi:hypothetical protein